ncbi:hypothetical protein ACROYT_G033603 [Oculina patagonica]
MRGVFTFSLVTVSFLFSTRTYANDLQSNASTSKCKPYPPSGWPGIPGTNGIPGIPGSPGSQGRDGSKGEKGTTGKRGLQGAVGIPGKSGPSGLKGSKGEMGVKGGSGTGIPGSTGPRGPKGLKGENGMGPKGEKGDAANIDPRQLANWKQCAWTGGTGKDNGKIKECSFNKLQSNTALRVSYQGNVNIYTNGDCNRWYFKFDGNECSGPTTIDSVLYNNWPGRLSTIHRNYFFEGYCENLARGTVRVELWVGKCYSHTQGNAYTGRKSVSRIMIEEVPPSQ